LLSAFLRAMLPPERSGEMAASPIVRGGNGRGGILIPSDSAAADVPKGHDPARIAIPSKDSASRGLALTPLFSSQNVTSYSTLATSQWNSNRNRAETGIAVTPTKQTTAVLSNRNKKTPPRGVAFWLRPGNLGKLERREEPGGSETRPYGDFKAGGTNGGVAVPTKGVGMLKVQLTARGKENGRREVLYGVRRLAAALLRPGSPGRAPEARKVGRAGGEEGEILRYTQDDGQERRAGGTPALREAVRRLSGCVRLFRLCRRAGE